MPDTDGKASLFSNIIQLDGTLRSKGFKTLKSLTKTPRRAFNTQRFLSKLRHISVNPERHAGNHERLALMMGWDANVDGIATDGRNTIR